MRQNFFLLIFFFCLLIQSSNGLAQIHGLDMDKVALDRGINAYEKGEYDRAIGIWNRLIKDNPQNPVYYYNRGNTYYGMKKYRKASRSYRAAARIGGPLRVASFLYMAICYDMLGKWRPAILSLGMALREKNIPTATYNMVLDELDRHMKREKKLFSMGEKAFLAEKYHRALRYLRMAWILNPSSSNSFMIGYTYLKMGDIPSAKRNFSRIQDQEIWEEARLLIEKVTKPSKTVSEQQSEAKAPKPSRFNSYFDGSYGQNSNPYTQAQTTDNEITSDFKYTFAIGASYKYLRRELSDSTLSVDGYGEQFKNDSSTKSEGVTISNPINLYTRSTTLALNPSFYLSEYGGDSYLNTGGLSLTYTKMLDNSRVYSSMSYTRNIPAQDELDYMEGNIYSLTFGISRYFGMDEIGMTFTYSVDNLVDSEDSISSNATKGLSATYYKQLGKKWSFDLGLSYSLIDYEPDTDGFRREDKTTTLSFKVSYAALKKLSFYLSNTNTINASNLETDDEDYNYNQNVLALGLSYSL